MRWKRDIVMLEGKVGFISVSRENGKLCWQDNLEVCTLTSELFSLGSNLDPALSRGVDELLAEAWSHCKFLFGMTDRNAMANHPA